MRMLQMYVWALWFTKPQKYGSLAQTCCSNPCFRNSDKRNTMIDSQKMLVSTLDRIDNILAPWLTIFNLSSVFAVLLIGTRMMV